jgi:hypothetical protein
MFPIPLINLEPNEVIPMEYRCARCKRKIGEHQPSVFHRFEHYHLSCIGYDIGKMGQIIRK